jgi:hypothetical protein
LDRFLQYPSPPSRIHSFEYGVGEYVVVVDDVVDGDAAAVVVVVVVVVAVAVVEVQIVVKRFEGNPVVEQRVKLVSQPVIDRRVVYLLDDLDQIAPPISRGIFIWVHLVTTLSMLLLFMMIMLLLLLLLLGVLSSRVVII